MDGHIILDDSIAETQPHAVLFVPAICASVSVVILLIQKYSSGLHLRGTTLNRSVRNANAGPRMYSAGFPLPTRRRLGPDPEHHANVWKVLRLAACFILVVISIVTIAIAEPCAKALPGEAGLQDSMGVMKNGLGHGGHWGGHKGKHKKHRVDLCMSQEQAEQMALGAFYMYASVLALLAVAIQSKFRLICHSHLGTLLILALMVDIWVVLFPMVPLFSFGGTALDWCSRARAAVLAFAAILVPVYIRRGYVLQEEFARASLNRPTSGGLIVKNVTVRDVTDGPNLLTKLSFSINPGEKIGVVSKNGETSALGLALLRETITEGKVYLDGIPTETISRDALRSHIALISDHLGIHSCTVRQALNPYKSRNNTTLVSALRLVGSALELEDGVEELGAEERMSLALARAVVCRSKVIVLDERGIKPENMPKVQSIIRAELGSSTLIILACRLHSIIDVAKVLVLDGGKFVEFGPPKTLVRKWTGTFKKMVNESEERDEYYARLPK